MRDKPYATAREFQQSANAHMKRVARAAGRPTQRLIANSSCSDSSLVSSASRMVFGS